MKVPDHVIPFDAADFETKELSKMAKSLFPQGGIIIIGLNKNNELRYFNDNEFLHGEFGDPHHVEEPLVYMSAPAAIKRLQKLKEENATDKLYLALWVHPDAGVPLEKYLKTTGNQFPGSPRQ